jgi:hypothetical protein
MLDGEPFDSSDLVVKSSSQPVHPLGVVFDCGFEIALRCRMVFDPELHRSRAR